MPPKPQLTHFICLPLTSAAARPMLERGLNCIRAEVSKRSELAGLDGSVRPVGTLHLTLGMMSLVGSEQVEKAIRRLQHLDINDMLRRVDLSHAPDSSIGARQAPPSIDAQNAHVDNEKWDPAPIYVELQHISSMHIPQNTSVLYTEPNDSSNRLYDFCKMVNAAFSKDDLLAHDTRPLKLHVTIVNTIYAAKSSKLASKPYEGGQDTKDAPDESKKLAQRKRRGKPFKFDARDLLEDLNRGNFLEGGMRLEKIAICKMGAEKMRDETGKVIDERYQEIASRELPK